MGGVAAQPAVVRQRPALGRRTVDRHVPCVGRGRGCQWVGLYRGAVTATVPGGAAVYLYGSSAPGQQSLGPYLTLSVRDGTDSAPSPTVT